MSQLVYLVDECEHKIFHVTGSAEVSQKKAIICVVVDVVK